MLINFLQNYLNKKTIMTDDINFFTIENNVKIIKVSSQTKGCLATNIFNNLLLIFVLIKLIIY